MWRGRVLTEALAESLKCEIPYEEMFLYKIHVRGYTMQKNSKVGKKRNFDRTGKKKFSLLAGVGSYFSGTYAML